MPTAREAAAKGKIDILARPQLVTIENQTALVNVGKEVEIPPGSGQRRSVGVILQVTPGRANNKQVPVRMVVEVSSVNKDQTTLNIHHMETSPTCPLGERMRIRGGVASSGKEQWIEMTVTEITSREHLERLMKESPTWQKQY